MVLLKQLMSHCSQQGFLRKFLNPETKFINEMEEEGDLQVDGVLIEISENGKAVKIEKLYEEVSNTK